MRPTGPLSCGLRALVAALALCQLATVALAQSPPPPPVWVAESCSFGELHRLTAPANVTNNTLLTANPPTDTGSAGNWTFTPGSTVAWVNNAMRFDGTSGAYVVFGGASASGGNALYHVAGSGAVVSFGGSNFSISGWGSLREPTRPPRRASGSLQVQAPLSS